MTKQPVANDTLLQQLRWRYATKKFDPAKKILPEQWRTLEEALVLTPSSFGLQPWKFLVVTDDAVRRKLRPISWNQAQVVECSHLVVFAYKKHVGVREIDEYLQRISEVRGTAVASMAAYREMMLGNLVEGARSISINEWALRQVYIALGNFMTAAAMLGIDTCPIEGFEPEKYDEVLGLPKRDLASAVVCAVGFRSADDKYAALPKVRFEHRDVIEKI